MTSGQETIFHQMAYKFHQSDQYWTVCRFQASRIDIDHFYVSWFESIKLIFTGIPTKQIMFDLKSKLVMSKEPMGFRKSAYISVQILTVVCMVECNDS